MRRFASWLLLLFSTLYFLGGYFSIRVIHSVEVAYQMNPEEAAIAEELQAETGLEPNIKILRDYEVEAIGGGYSGVFIFSKKVEGKEVNFIIDPSPTQTLDQEFLLGRQPDQDGQDDNALIFSRILYHFIVEGGAFSLANHEIPYSGHSFSSLELRDLHIPAIPTPPPQLI